MWCDWGVLRVLAHVCFWFLSTVYVGMPLTDVPGLC